MKSEEERLAHNVYMREYNRKNRDKKAIQDKKYYLKNRDKKIQTTRLWYEAHKEYKQKYSRQYWNKNKAKLLEKKRLYQKSHRAMINANVRKNRAFKYKTDPAFKLKRLLRRALYGHIKYATKKVSKLLYLGCTAQELKVHIESQFKKGMTWQNWSKTGWHIDHIRPISSFDFTDIEQVKLACHYKNLQPLWAADNFKKSDKF